MDRKKTPATQSPSAYATDDDDARLAALLFGDEANATRPATEVPSSHATDDDDARLAALLFGDEAKATRPATEVPSSHAADDEASFLVVDELGVTRPVEEVPSSHAADDEASFLVVDELGVTRPVEEVPSSHAARMFGEEAARIYGVMGRLLHLNRLPVGDLSLITVGFRITDRPSEKWTRRFNQFKYGEPAAIRAATRTFCAAVEDFLPPGNPRVVVVSAISSGHMVAESRTPASTLASALARSRGWEWRPWNITKYPHPSLTRTASAAERDATVDGVYLATAFGGEPGLVIVVDDFCTRGATLADIARAVRESNPGWKVQGASLAKAERAAYWKGELTNAHIPDEMDAIWRGDRNAPSPFY